MIYECIIWCWRVFSVPGNRVENLMLGHLIYYIGYLDNWLWEITYFDWFIKLGFWLLNWGSGLLVLKMGFWTSGAQICIQQTHHHHSIDISLKSNSYIDTTLELFAC